MFEFVTHAVKVHDSLSVKCTITSPTQTHSAAVISNRIHTPKLQKSKIHTPLSKTIASFSLACSFTRTIHTVAV